MGNLVIYGWGSYGLMQTGKVRFPRVFSLNRMISHLTISYSDCRMVHESDPVLMRVYRTRRTDPSSKIWYALFGSPPMSFAVYPLMSHRV